MNTATQTKPRLTIRDIYNRDCNVAELLLQRSGWVIVSTVITGGTAYQNEVNERRALDLFRNSDDRAPYYSCTGKWEGESEHSRLVLIGEHTNPQEICAILRQDAILTSEGLLWRNGTLQPYDGYEEIHTRAKGGVVKIDDIPADCYTEFDGDFFKFNIKEA